MLSTAFRKSMVSFIDEGKSLKSGAIKLSINSANLSVYDPLLENIALCHPCVILIPFDFLPLPKVGTGLHKMW